MKATSPLSKEQQERGVTYALHSAVEDTFGRKIHLDFLELTDEQFLPLLGHQGFKDRRAINLNWNKLTDASLEALANRPEITQSLQYLRAYGNNFSKEGLRLFVEKCPRLLSIERPELDPDLQDTLSKRREEGVRHVDQSV